MSMQRWLAVAALCATVLPVDASLRSSGASARHAQATFSTRRETVRVDVLVTENGRPVRNLAAADFEVLDSGVPQQVDFVSFAQLPLTVAIALDASTSISAEALEHLRDGGRAVLANVKADDQVALVTFTDAVNVRERPTSNADRVRSALARIEPSRRLSGGTALIDACYTAVTLLDGDAGRGLVLAFTDGVDTSSWLPGDRVLQAARRSNAVVYAVSTSPLPKGLFLRELSDATGGGAIEITSTDAVRAAFVRILDEFRQRYLVSFSPANVPASGWHPLTVRVKNRKVDVKARAGYTR
jgi:VWFA-related protein